MTAAELFAALERVSGVPSPRRRLPHWFLEAVAWFGETIARLRQRPRPSRSRVCACSIGSARQLSARRDGAWCAVCSLDETLRDTVHWFTSQGMAGRRTNGDGARLGRGMIGRVWQRVLFELVVFRRRRRRFVSRTVAVVRFARRSRPAPGRNRAPSAQWRCRTPAVAGRKHKYERPA